MDDDVDRSRGSPGLYGRRVGCEHLGIMDARTVLAVGALALFVQAQPVTATAATKVEIAQPVRVGSGDHVFTWNAGWGKVPGTVDLGNTHGAVVRDSKGLIYFNTDTERAVCVFKQDGTFVKAFGKEWKGGLHGMCINREGDEDFLYITHTGRRMFAKLRLDGTVVWKRGYPEEPGVYKNGGKRFRPTSIAVGPDGDVYVGDGYGLSYVHQFGKNQKWIRTFGGPGTKPGLMRTPHGLWMDTREDRPRLFVADRENHRLQIFDLEGKLMSMVDKGLRRPCNMSQWGEFLVVADLAGRITILDHHNEVACQVGDQPNPKMRARNGIKKEQWRDGHFLSPHGACWDEHGNIYVMDWNRWGRMTKLERVKGR